MTSQHHDNATIAAPDDTLNVPAPSDATQVHGWLEAGDGLATRLFNGTVREAARFSIRVRGLQRDNGTCRRWVVVETESGLGAPLEPEAGRQLAAALSAAADEIEGRAVAWPVDSATRPCGGIGTHVPGCRCEGVWR